MNYASCLDRMQRESGGAARRAATQYQRLDISECPGLAQEHAGVIQRAVRGADAHSPRVG